MNIIFDLKNTFIEACKKSFDIDLDFNEIVIETPKDSKLGDYSTSIAMKLTKKLHKSPVEIANTIISNINNERIFEKLEIAGPGFINMFIKNTYLSNVINEIFFKNEQYGNNFSGENEKILVEYVSANPTGDLHVGHAKGAAWGDSVTRILKASGYDVLREYYINDGGNQINNLALSILCRYKQLFDSSIEMIEDGYHGKDIIDLAKKVYELDGNKWINVPENEALSYFKDIGVKYELDKIKAILNEYGVEFDYWASELKIRENNSVNNMIKELTNKGLTYEQEGAIFFKSTNFGDDKDRVLLKSDGSFTYLAPDIVYHLNKLSRGYTHLVDLLGADHHGYISRMKAALMAFGYPKDCLDIDIYQMVRLIENGEEVKMSKRTGKSVTLSDLIQDIGVDTTRYFFCSRDINSHLDFDLTLAKTKSMDNPVFYAQYAHARMCSILKLKQFNSQNGYQLLKEDKEINLLKLLIRFPDEVASAAKLRAPNKICNYIQELASEFHSYYGSTRIINEEQKELTNERLALVNACKIVLKNALYLVGVSAPIDM